MLRLVKVRNKRDWTRKRPRSRPNERPKKQKKQQTRRSDNRKPRRRQPSCPVTIIQSFTVIFYIICSRRERMTERNKS